jgi:hypothetical protein
MPEQPDRDALMTLSEAMETYGHARTWWYAQFNAGKLTPYNIPGDRNTYVHRAQVAAYLQPQPGTKQQGLASDG